MIQYLIMLSLIFLLLYQSCCQLTGLDWRWEVPYGESHDNRVINDVHSDSPASFSLAIYGFNDNEIVTSLSEHTQLMGERENEQVKHRAVRPILTSLFFSFLFCLFLLFLSKCSPHQALLNII